MLKIKELRLDFGKTQTEMAKKLNVSRQVYANWENEINEPDYKSLICISEIFDVTVDYLLGLEDDFGARVAPIAPHVDLSEKEKALLTAFNNLLPETQDFILKTAQSLQESSVKKVNK